VMHALIPIAAQLREIHGKFDLTVNGIVQTALDADAQRAADSPITYAVGKAIQPGENLIEVHSDDSLPYMTVHAVNRYYTPWQERDKEETTRRSDEYGLTLAVYCDSKEVNIGDRVRCSVQAKRFGLRSWGMQV